MSAEVGPARSPAKVAEERRKAEIETLYTQGLLATVYKQVRKPIRDDWEMVGAELWALLKWWKLGENGHEQICAALGITDPDDIIKHLASLTDAEILRFVIALAAATTSANSLTLLEGIAKRHAIDTKQIRKDATAAVKAQALSSKK